MIPSGFDKNHFELFGLVPAFQFDLTQLEQSWRDIQAQVHPDKYAHQGDAERRLAMQWATHVNEAYQTLRQPLARARYLLQLRGVESDEASNTAMSPAFLMEQMEWREAIAEARAAESLEELERLDARLRADIQARHERLRTVLDEQQHFTLAAEQVRELKFMEKLREEIHHALETLES